MHSMCLRLCLGSLGDKCLQGRLSEFETDVTAKAAQLHVAHTSAASREASIVRASQEKAKEFHEKVHLVSLMCSPLL